MLSSTTQNPGGRHCYGTKSDNMNICHQASQSMFYVRLAENNPYINVFILPSEQMKITKDQKKVLVEKINVQKQRLPNSRMAFQKTQEITFPDPISQTVKNRQVTFQSIFPTYDCHEDNDISKHVTHVAGLGE